MKDAFKHNDGQVVPLVWNHQHDDPNEVLGHALLENREEGVYAYCTFNNTESGKTAKELVQHGDVVSLSIYANKLKQDGGNVVHGVIREVSLVLAGANPEAFIDNIVCHSDDAGNETVEEAIICAFEDLELAHADEPKKEPEEKKSEDDKKSDDDETVQDVLDTLNEKQKAAFEYVVGKVVEMYEKDDKEPKEPKENKENKESEGGNETMKHNAFDKETKKENVLSHSDMESIIATAKTPGVGSLQSAIQMFIDSNEDLAHNADSVFVNESGESVIDQLFPEYHDVKSGAPDLLTRDQGWVSTVMQKVKKSPYARVRTRQADARIAELRAKGYQKKGDQKTVMAGVKLLSRTTDPQTIYIKEELHRDDILDITDFSVVDYQRNIMKMTLNEEIAKAIMIGDQREDGDPDKIHDTNIRPIYGDADLYTIYADVDIEAARTEIQGTNTSANFSENYIYAEAIIKAALYAREKYKGAGTPDFYCTPHLVNVMLLARDLNGRRIYTSKSDLAAALNVGNIYTAEQFEGVTRKDKDEKTKKLLGLFTNLSSYQLGSVRGGEITSFHQFDIDFNKEKFLMETRLSGANTEPYSAIALEEPVTAG
jgi:hypothetical protein